MGGASYTGFVRDTTGNCSSVTYNASMSVGNFELKDVFDNSFYNGGIYYVQLSANRTIVNPAIEIMDISGRSVLNRSLTAFGKEVNENISVENLPKGIYIVRITQQSGIISVARFVK